MKTTNLRRLALLCATASLGLFGITGQAEADFGLAGFDGQAATGPAPQPIPDPEHPTNPGNFAPTYTQAGGIPYSLTTQFNFNTHQRKFPGIFGFELQSPDGPTKDVFVDAPAGLLGSAATLPKCDLGDLAYDEGTSSGPLCPPGSQVGVARLVSPVNLFFLAPTIAQPLYNMDPGPGSPARFAFNFSGTVVVIDARLRAGPDYGVSLESHNTGEGTEIDGTEITFWGAPAADEHTPERACAGEPSPAHFGPTCAAGIPATSFLRMPTSCTGPLQTDIHIDSWLNPGAVLPDGGADLSDPNWKSASYLSHEPAGLTPTELSVKLFPGLDPSEWGPPVGDTGCESVPFEPSISVNPTTDVADSPSGLEVDLSLPQEWSDPEALQQSDLRKAVVKLPAGMSVNPASANGLGSCSPAQIDLNSKSEATCPDDSKIGSAVVETPLLDHPVDGAVYLAKQGDNPFGSLLAMYLDLEDPASGTIIKLPGRVEVGPDGQLTTSFDNQPQLPFSKLHLELFGGAGAPLITPSHCGAFEAEAQLSPWSGNPPVDLTSSFSLTAGPGGSCANADASRPFAPKLKAGTQNPLAGAYSPFALKLTREDGTQRLTGLSLTLPPGLEGKLAGIPYCPDAALASIPTGEGTGAAQLAAPACPAASRLGTVTVGAGAGPDPFYVQTGRAYLAGPYKGAPLSLAIATPAVAGPFDLGNVVVRAALQVNAETAQITAVSDPLPTILDGIPLDLRDVRVEMNRPGFTLNPTSCDPMSIDGTVSGTEGASAPVSSRFQVGNCGALGFKPRLSLRLVGETRRAGNPALRATLRMPTKPGANVAWARVTLPRSVAIDNAHIQNPCTRVQFAAGQCPPSSVLGHARAFSPLLDAPLEGPVYFRSNGGERALPDLVADLNGQIHVVLVGAVDAKKGRIRNTFFTVPDAPVSKFSLDLFGGRRSYLENTTDLCRARSRAIVQFNAHNGKIADSSVPLRTRCGKGGKHRRSAR